MNSTHDARHPSVKVIDFTQACDARVSSRHQAWRDMQRSMHEQALADESGIFQGLHSMLGGLSTDTKHRILSFLNAPSVVTWDAVADRIIKGGTTMWQLWVQVDADAPRSVPYSDDMRPWPCIPDAQCMREALVELGRTAPTD